MRRLFVILGAAIVLVFGLTGGASATSRGGAQPYKISGCDTYANGETACLTGFGVGFIVWTPQGDVVSIPQYFRWTYTVTYPDGQTRSGSGIVISHELWRDGDEGILFEESIRLKFSDTDTSGVTCTELGHGQIANGRLIFDRVTVSCS